MNKDQSELLARIGRLNVWRRGSERAPHKPLLLLLALSRVAQADACLAEFNEIEETLRRLLIQYGPPRKSVHPEYPFWRLQSDGIWEVEEGKALMRRKGGTDPPRKELVRHHVKGGFRKEIF